jgi:uncharacterized protein (TIGR02453 family)
MLSTHTLKFLSELKEHNERAWFEKNKARYETSVRDAMFGLLAELQPRLRKVSRNVVVDPRPVGGSVMRIYRDVRFSKDKSPYKTHLAAMFWNVKGKEEPAPGFFLHVEPGGKSMLAGGIWRPEGAALKAIRDAIAGDVARWKKVTSGLTKGGCQSGRESLGLATASTTRPPAIEDLKAEGLLRLTFTDAGVAVPDAVGRRQRWPFCPSGAGGEVLAGRSGRRAFGLGESKPGRAPRRTRRAAAQWHQPAQGPVTPVPQRLPASRWRGSATRGRSDHRRHRHLQVVLTRSR